MQYMGSKNRLARYLLPIMLAERKAGQCWVEPFVGGANMIDKVPGNRIGNDSHEYLIALLQALQNGWVPPIKVSKETYHQIKQNPNNYNNELVGFVGFVCSFGSKWWGGYASNKRGDNYAEVGSRGLAKQASKFDGVKFICGSYLSLDIPENSLIYCDPPYEGTTRYKDAFDHDAFWDWCQNKAQEGHTVFVSEHNAPGDFECIKEVGRTSTLNKNSKAKKIEKLFIIK